MFKKAGFKNEEIWNIAKKIHVIYHKGAA